MWFSGAWPKLGVFMQDLYGLKGRALFIDMDTTISGPLDGCFEHTAPLVGIDTGKNWQKGGTAGPAGAHPPLLGTGVFAFILGAQIQILERFQANPEAAFAATKIEQVWVQEHASSAAQIAQFMGSEQKTPCHQRHKNHHIKRRKDAPNPLGVKPREGEHSQL